VVIKESGRNFDISLLSTLSNNMSKSLDNFANINKIDLLIRAMDVRLRSTNSQSNNLGSGVFSLKFFEEWNRATFSKGSDLLTLKVLLRGFLKSVLQPTLKLFLLPATSCMSSLDCNFCVIGNISCELFSHDLISLVSIKNRAKSH